MPNADPRNVTRNDRRNRYELSVDGQLAVCDFEHSDDTITFTHTEVPEGLEGQGVGSALARGALDDVRAQGFTVVPDCPFIADFMAKHEAYKDLLDPAYGPLEAD